MPSRVNPIWEPLVPNDRTSRHVRSRTCIASATAPTSGFWNGPLGWRRVWAVSVPVVDGGVAVAPGRWRPEWLWCLALRCVP